ncbi:MAG TPA: nitroreductase family deazaflavin-dependent oxidoreductase, partial [Jatrophihabitantaceae bacterium]|nr:nitroreductase family deazaflavin-dependent oxidoreductase [Jatrophihabitantaceae bacterium]
MSTPKLKPRPQGLEKPYVKRIIKTMSAAHIRLYRWSGGHIGKKWHVGSALRKGVPTCLVTTTGAKSGLPRTVPLLFMPDGDNVVLVASQGGLPSNPAWLYNVRKNPDVTVQVMRSVRQMRAHVASPDERERLWPRLVDLYADFASYQSWTDR